MNSIAADRAGTPSALSRLPLRSASGRPDPRAAAVREHSGGQPVWRVPCGDLINRDRCVTVLVENNQVLLVSPPGESARLSPGQLGQLRAALNEAAALAER